MSVNRTLSLLGILSFIITLLACGKGPESVPPPGRRTPPRPLTFAQRIHAQELIDQGYTGNGVISTIIDEGIDFSQPELLGKEMPGGGKFYQYLSRNAIWAGPGLGSNQRVKLNPKVILSGNLRTEIPRELHHIISDGYIREVDSTQRMYRGDPNSHGTSMAKALISLAPQTKIASYSEDATGYYHSILHSQTLGSSVTSISIPVKLQDILIDYENLQVADFNNPQPQEFKLKYQVNQGNDGRGIKDSIIIVIAHNVTHVSSLAQLDEGQKKPFNTPQNNIIVTVAVDTQDRITSISRRCGKTQRFCVAIPSGGHTSPTATLLAGAVALLKEAIAKRGLKRTAQQYVQAILQTCKPLGPPEETGRGLVNIHAAFNALLAM